MTKGLTTMLAIAWTSAGVAFPVEQSWTGKISDNLCNAGHEKIATSVFPPLNDEDCVTECVKAGGKYVFVDKDNKVMPIANQEFDALKDHGGDTVILTGELKGDAITVSKIEVAAPKS